MLEPPDHQIFQIFLFQMISSSGQLTTIDQDVFSSDVIMIHGILILPIGRAHYILGRSFAFLMESFMLASPLLKNKQK